MNIKILRGTMQWVCTAIAVLLATGIALFIQAGYSNGQWGVYSVQPANAEPANEVPLALENLPVMEEEGFGTIIVDISIDDFNNSGFAFGDGINVVFSNGYQLLDIPYYNGYYASVGDLLIVGYPNSSHIKIAKNYDDTIWSEAGLSQGDTATITLNEAGAYLDVQEAFDIVYTNGRADYTTDEEFANFRACSGGNLKKNIVYRSASPIDNKYQRASYVETLIQAAGVKFILDLSDNPEEAASLIAEDIKNGIDVSYFEELDKAGCVALLDLSASFPSDTFVHKLCEGLICMSQHEGPYLIHCVEGKDRTGFVCVLLEALCGATYDEMLTDYMETYTNYYKFTKESEPEKYAAISGLNLDGMLRYLADVDDDADLSKIDFIEPARNYLLKGGMTNDQIDALIKCLTQ